MASPVPTEVEELLFVHDVLRMTGEDLAAERFYWFAERRLLRAMSRESDHVNAGSVAQAKALDIPSRAEMEAMRRIEKAVLDEWVRADKAGERYFPHEFMYRILRNGSLEGSYQIDPVNSWMVAAAEKNLPMWVPGWEDSTLGNMYAGHCISGDVKNVHTVRTGIEYMTTLAEWYTNSSVDSTIGFFQIGGGIAGDFPICVVPMLHQDLQRENVPVWGYFCQISDSTTSYGSYSGAVPNEKITWGKLGVDTPKFIIESDASIVAPLMFALVLGW